MSTGERTIVSPSLCECGCGGVTNARQIEAWELREQGLKNVEIAEMWGADKSTVSAALRRAPARFLTGHSTYLRMGPVRVRWFCERCGGESMTSEGKEIPRYCQRTACMAQHSTSPATPIIRRAVEVRHSRRRIRLSSFFADRRATITARIERDLTAEVVREALSIARTERSARIQASYDRRRAEVAAKQAVRLERRLLRDQERAARAEVRALAARLRYWRTLEARRKFAPLELRRRESADQRLANWICEQGPEDQALVLAQNHDPRNWRDRHFDAPIGHREGKPLNLYEVVPTGYNPHGDATQWNDPVAAVVENAWDQDGEITVDNPRFMDLARQAPIVPFDFVGRCERDELRLILTDDAPAFFTLRNRVHDSWIPNPDPRSGFNAWKAT